MNQKPTQAINYFLSLKSKENLLIEINKYTVSNEILKPMKITNNSLAHTDRRGQTHQRLSCKSLGDRNHRSRTPPRSNNQLYTGLAPLCLDTHFPRDISDRTTELLKRILCEAYRQSKKRWDSSMTCIYHTVFKQY